MDEAQRRISDVGSIDALIGALKQYHGRSSLSVPTFILIRATRHKRFGTSLQVRPYGW